MRSDDIDHVTALLAYGFRTWRKASFWSRALRRLERHGPPLGYVLEARGTVVGVLLLIASESEHGTPRYNVSSWFVEPAYSVYGSLLVRHALRERAITFVNVTPAPTTWSLLEAQGFQRYSDGRSFVFPIAARRGAGRVTRVRGPVPPGPDLSRRETVLLEDHAGWGCLSLVCSGPSGRTPFVFGLRRRYGIIPFVYLIYCRDLADLQAHARSLGRYLLRYGAALVVADSPAIIPDMPGWFQNGFPKFFHGARPPLPHDLAYTERALFGV